MDHEGFIIRPPSEGDSILLQVTLGCSHGACAFCGAYRGKPFALKDEAQVMADIIWAARHMPACRRLFLMDGDALAAPTPRLQRILHAVREHLPQVRRISAYASARALLRKHPEELSVLRTLGLTRLYMGLESGDDTILKRMNKGATVQNHLDAAAKAHAADMNLNVTVLLGLAGPAGSLAHARATAAALSAMAPAQIAALSLMLVPGTPLAAEAQASRFTECDAGTLLRELATLVQGLELPRGLFLANHASNHLPLKARLPKGKASLLRRIDGAIRGETALREENMRRL